MPQTALQMLSAAPVSGQTLRNTHNSPERTRSRPFVFLSDVRSPAADGWLARWLGGSVGRSSAIGRPVGRLSACLRVPRKSSRFRACQNSTSRAARRDLAKEGCPVQGNANPGKFEVNQFRANSSKLVRSKPNLGDLGGQSQSQSDTSWAILTHFISAGLGRFPPSCSKEFDQFWRFQPILDGFFRPKSGEIDNFRSWFAKCVRARPHLGEFVRFVEPGKLMMSGVLKTS